MKRTPIHKPTYSGDGTAPKHSKQQAEKWRGSSRERGYTHKWDKARKHYLMLHPFCVHCTEVDVLTPANEVDHIIPHKRDMELFWDMDNWQGLCKSCHSKKTRKENKLELYPDSLPVPGIPVTVVCGAPYSGKTSYVKKNKGDDDVVIDLDDIKVMVSGKPLHHDITDDELVESVHRRNRILAALCLLTHGRAWFIVCAPKLYQRRHWRKVLHTDDIRVLRTDPSDIEMRIDTDTEREDTGKNWAGLAHDWWINYVADPEDKIINF